MSAILETRRFRDFDWLLTLLATGIVFFGTWQIHNAQPLENYWKKQLIGLGVSLVALFGLVLLVIVLIPGIGIRINGQQCWIRMPVVGQFQPSEFVKIPTVLMLAYYYGKQRGSALGWMEIAVGVGILALPIGLILLEPDAGQVITYLPLLAVVLFLSSVRMWLVLPPLALRVGLIP